MPMKMHNMTTNLPVITAPKLFDFTKLNGNTNEHYNFQRIILLIQAAMIERL